MAMTATARRARATDVEPGNAVLMIQTAIRAIASRFGPEPCVTTNSGRLPHSSSVRFAQFRRGVRPHENATLQPAGFVCLFLVMLSCLSFVAPLRRLRSRTLPDLLFERASAFIKWNVSATRHYLIVRNKIRVSNAFEQWSQARAKLLSAHEKIEKFKGSAVKFKNGSASYFSKGLDYQFSACARAISSMGSATEARHVVAKHFGSQYFDQALLRRGFFTTRLLWQLALCVTRFAVLTASTYNDSAYPAAARNLTHEHFQICSFAKLFFDVLLVVKSLDGFGVDYLARMEEILRAIYEACTRFE